jgi:hypothetical protein
MKYSDRGDGQAHDMSFMLQIYAIFVKKLKEGMKVLSSPRRQCKCTVLFQCEIPFWNTHRLLALSVFNFTSEGLLLPHSWSYCI